MLQEAFNALDINCTHYTKTRKPQKKKKKIKVSKTIWGQTLFKLYTTEWNILTENI